MQNSFHRLVLIGILVLTIALPALIGQARIELTVLSGSITSTCSDRISGQDLLWQVRINTGPWYTYPKMPNCFSSLPNLQFKREYACTDTIPRTLSICFRAFENNGLFGTCEIVPRCLEEVCQTFTVPPSGGAINYELRIPDGRSTAGAVQFRIQHYLDPILASDSLCGALPLGFLPEGGKLGDRATFKYSNTCAQDNGEDEDIPGIFSVEAGVWFTFYTGSIPPGSIGIEVRGDRSVPGQLPIDLEAALFASTDGSCVLTKSPVSWQRNELGTDAFLFIPCPAPRTTYYLLVDGDIRGQTRGRFSVQVTDQGVVPPSVTVVDTVVCAGDSLKLGNIWLKQEGHYRDTLLSQTGCDSIIDMTLRFRSPLGLSWQVILPASGPLRPDGQIKLIPTGGSGTHKVNWCNGDTTLLSNTLRGSENCCISLFDMGCRTVLDTCLIVPAQPALQWKVTPTATSCVGTSDGEITISVVGGSPPYSLYWNNAGKLDTLVITHEEDSVLIQRLTAGDYQFSLQDVRQDTAFSVTIGTPSPVVLKLLELREPVCPDDCNGMLAVSASGGQGTYRYQWLTQEPNPDPQHLCPGTYRIMAQDENSCSSDTLTVSLQEPAPVDLTINQLEPIRCNGENTGAIQVESSRPLEVIQWNTGLQTATLQQLAAGQYLVTVTDDRGCSASAGFTLLNPPVLPELNIVIDRKVSCPDSQDGRIRVSSAAVMPWEILWNTGASGTTLSGLSAGNYQVTLTDANGCIQEQQIHLPSPEPIQATFLVVPPTCQGTQVELGRLLVTQVKGGESPYIYALDNGNFSTSRVFEKLTSGMHELKMQDAQGCITSFPLEVAGVTPPTIDLPAGMTIHLGDSLFLAPAYSGENLAWEWYIPGTAGIFAQTESLALVPTQSGLYEVRIKDTIHLCTAIDRLMLTVDHTRRVYFPTAFSPNGDGINEVFYPFGGDDVLHVQFLRIFDRYGSMVFEARDFQANDLFRGWDGTFHGHKLPEGAYVYFAEILFQDGRRVLFKGTVNLLR